MLTHDALNTYVADRQQARMHAATTARTGRLLRRARVALGVAGPTGSANVLPVPTPSASSPVVAEAATGAATGNPARVPAATVLRTAAATGTPVAHDPAAA